MSRSPAVQLPFHRSEASREGRRVYRKQILPAGTVEHPKHGPLDFTPDIIRELVRTFDAGAMTQVPFVLAAEGNLHTDDPERFRGEVKGLEAKDDGLYALVETTEQGAAVLEQNPKLPVSVRVQRPTAGKFAGKPVLGHVLGTMDEVAKGMSPWQLIEASSELEVVDLSDGAFTLAGTVAEEKTTETPEGFTKEDVGFFRKLKERLERAEAGKKEEPGKSEEPGKEPEKDEDAEAERLLAELFPEAETDPGKQEEPGKEEPGKETERELEPAALSQEDRTALELANSRAEQAIKDAAEARREAAEQRFSRERAELLAAGVPPADVELARPLLEHGDPEPIEMSNGQKVDAAEVIRKLLKSREGTIDFTERGSGDGDDAERTEAKELAKKMGEQYGKTQPREEAKA